MKRIYLSAIFAMSIMVASAQTSTETNKDNNTGKHKSGKANLSTVSTDDNIREMATQMQLNEGQYIRLRDLNRAKKAQIQEINNMYANDAAMRQSKLAAANQEFEKQLAQSVSPSQFTAYLATQGRAPEANPGTIRQAVGYGGQSLEGGAATGTSNNGGVVNSEEPRTNTSTPKGNDNLNENAAGDDKNLNSGKEDSNDRSDFRKSKMKQKNKKNQE